MTRADERLERLLLAFPLMADEPQLTLEELAVRLATTTRVLAKDFASLERYDLPAGFIESVQVMIDEHGASMRSAHFKRPPRLNRPEMVALELGLSMLEQEVPVDERDQIVQARARLAAVTVRKVATITDGGATTVTHGGPAMVVETARASELGALAVLQRGLETHRVVAMTYQRPNESAASMRHVHPYALVRADANVYLVGYCERAAAQRVFRLDRVLGAELTDTLFTAPVDFSVHQVLTQGRVFRESETTDDTLVVRYSPQVARWIAEREHKPLDEDGALVVSYPLADESWAIRHVLQYGPDAVIVSPRALRDAVKALLDELLTDAASVVLLARDEHPTEDRTDHTHQ